MMKKRPLSETAIDRHIGLRLHARRLVLGMRQHDLAHLLGVSFQQLHKYERGINRLSGGRLYQAAHALGVPILYFFEGLDEPQTAPRGHERCRIELGLAVAALGSADIQVLAELARHMAAMRALPHEAKA